MKKSGSVDADYTLEEIVLRLRERLLQELVRTEGCEEFRSAGSEQRMRILTGIFKALQGVEEMMARINRDGNAKSANGLDVVEFRRQLEKQIARLVEQEASETVFGKPEAR